MDAYPLTRHGLDLWIKAQPPEAAALLESIREKIFGPPNLAPASICSAISPLKSILEEAKGGIPTDEHGYALRPYATQRNRELGFITQDLPAVPDNAIFELDSLLMIGYGMEALTTLGERTFLTHYGEHLLGDPLQLLRMAHRSLVMIRPNDPVGQFWLVLLPWLLAEAPPEGLWTLTCEAFGTDEVDPDQLEFGFFSLYTYARALGMFIDRSPSADTEPPKLSDSGRAGVIELLRMLAFDHQLRITQPMSN